MSKRPFVVERKGERNRMPLPKWSHQKELESMIGKEIEITIVGSGDNIAGVLTGADLWAVQIFVASDKSVVTYMKHSIRSFRAAKPAA